MEKKNKKSEFLGEEEIKTMQKDIAELKGLADPKRRMAIEEERRRKKKLLAEKTITARAEAEKAKKAEEKKRQEELLAEKEKEEGEQRRKEITEEERRKRIAQEEEKKKKEEEAGERRRKEKIVTEEEKLIEFDKKLENIALKKEAVNKEKKQFLTEIKNFEVQLGPILKEEVVVENKIQEIEGLEKRASPEKRGRIEKKRWETDAQRRDIEKRKWSILKEIEKIEEKIKEEDLKYRQILKEEEEITKEWGEILQKRKEEELIRKKSRLKNEISQLIDEKKIIGNKRQRLLPKKDNLETELEKVLNEEKITEEVIQTMTAKEKETAEPKEQRKIEKERWKVEDDRKNLERRKWELEKEKKELVSQLKKAEEEYRVILEKENLLSGRLKEINRLLKISPEEEEEKKEPAFAEATADEEEEKEEIEAKRKIAEEGEKEKQKELLTQAERAKEEGERRKLIQEEIKKRITQTPAPDQQTKIVKEDKSSSSPLAATRETKKKLSFENSEEEIPETLIPKLPKKLSLIQRILIRTVIIAVLLLVIGFFYWFFVVKRPEPPEIILPEEKEAEEKTIEKPGIIIPVSLIPVNATETVEIMNSSEIPLLLSQLLEKTFETEGHIRILLKDINENKVIGLKEFFEAFEVNPPEGLLEKLNNDFTLFIYSSEEINRLGFITRIEEENFADLMLSWETTIEKDTEKLFEALGKEKPAPSPEFKETTYKNTFFRYVSFPLNNFGICWSISGDKFLFTSSGESIIKSIDKLIIQ